MKQERIKQLRTEAAAAGDHEQVTLCDAALAGNQDAIDACERVRDLARLAHMEAHEARLVPGARVTIAKGRLAGLACVVVEYDGGHRYRVIDADRLTYTVESSTLELAQ